MVVEHTPGDLFYIDFAGHMMEYIIPIAEK
jgi:hypothetical protein